MNKEEIVTGLIFEAIIEKAISDKRDLLKPSMQHFIDGGNVNGQFLITLIKLLRWTERKTLEVAEEYATQQCAAKDAEIAELKKVISEYQHHAITDPTNQKAEIERLKEFIEQFLQDPYPEDVFLPIPANVLEMIHGTLMDEYKMPIDRLTGYIGRRLRKPLMEQAKIILNNGN